MQLLPGARGSTEKDGVAILVFHYAAAACKAGGQAFQGTTTTTEQGLSPGQLQQRREARAVAHIVLRTLLAWMREGRAIGRRTPAGAITEIGRQPIGTRRRQAGNQRAERFGQLRCPGVAHLVEEQPLVFRTRPLIHGGSQGDAVYLPCPLTYLA
ncbi:hypothetical protein D3C78_1237890 [compost metagenome]